MGPGPSSGADGERRARGLLLPGAAFPILVRVIAGEIPTPTY
ncbi:hypothetical protein [Brachybacterium sacelli]